MPDRNTKVVQDACAAFGRGDIEAVLATLNPDVEWQALIGEDPTRVPTAGLRRGVSAVAEFFRNLGETVVFERFEPREFVSQGDNVVCFGSYKARLSSTGGEMSSDCVMVFTLRDGLIVRFREWSDAARLIRVAKPPL